MLFSNAASIYAGVPPPRRKAEVGTALLASTASGVIAGAVATPGINHGFAETVAPGHPGLVQAAATTAELLALNWALSSARVPRPLVLELPPYLPQLYHCSRLATEAHESTWRHLKGRAATVAAAVGPSLPAKLGIGAAIDIAAVAAGLSPLTGLVALSIGDAIVHSTEWACANEVGRMLQVEYPPLRNPADSSHPHPRSAAGRDAFLKFAGLVAQTVDRQPYDLQASKVSRELYPGQFYPYGSKDRSEAYADPVPDRPLFLDVDCGYYWDGCYGVDVGYGAILGRGAPLAIYAMSPRRFPSESDEHVTVFAGPDSDDVIHMVKGNGTGSTYRHPVYDLETDQIATTAFGTTTISSVTVHPAHDGDVHKAYVLTPKRHFHESRPVPRPTLHPFRPTWYRNVYAIRETRKVLGVPGDGHCEIVRAGIAGCATSYITNPTGWAAILTRCDTHRENKKAEPAHIAASAAMIYGEMADLALDLDPSEPLINRTRAAGRLTGPVKAVATEILNNLLGGRAGDLGRSYLAHVANGDVRFRPSMTEARSIVQEALLPHVGHPACTSDNSLVSVQTRVIEVTNGLPGPKDGGGLRAAFLRQLVLAVEARDELADGLHRLRTLIETLQAQSRPTQIATFMQSVEQTFQLVVAGSFSHKLAAHMKKEAGAYSDPRNIVNPNGAWRVIYSGYCVLAAEAAKRSGWYAFGLDLDSLAEVVAEKVAEQEADVLAAEPPALGASPRPLYAAAVDMSRFDGSVSGFLADTAHFCMRGIIDHFSPEAPLDAFDRVVKAHKHAIAQQGPVGFGLGTATISGSPETSIRNSLVCAFVGFCAFVRAGLTPARAYSRLGIYGGDDSLILVPSELRDSPELFTAIYERTARDFGLRAKVLHTSTDCMALLGRVFVRPHGSRGLPYLHHADVPRALGKFDLHVRGVPPAQAMLAKAAGLAYSDANTPVLRELVEAVLAHPDVAAVQVARDTLRALVSYNVVEHLDDEYLNPDGSLAPTITAAMVTEVLDRRRSLYSPCVLESVTNTLPVTLDGMVARVSTLANGGYTALGISPVPELVRQYHTAHGPAELCRVSTAKLGLPVPTELSIAASSTLPSVTAGRVTRVLVEGVKLATDAFGGPGAFATVASTKCKVVSHCLHEDLFLHRQLVAAAGREANHTARVAAHRDREAAAAALAAAASTEATHLLFVDPPWLADRDDGSPADPAAVCIAAYDAAPATAAICYNLGKRDAPVLLTHVVTTCKGKAWVLTHESGVLTTANVVRTGRPPRPASIAAARAAGLVWHTVVKDKLEPLAAHTWAVSSKV